jgi:hypothetical protein
VTPTDGNGSPVESVEPVSAKPPRLEALAEYRAMLERLENCRPRGNNEKLYRDALALLYRTVLAAEG